jgi:peptidoglycan/LPS O-acetylase OafA/YrhL
MHWRDPPVHHGTTSRTARTDMPRDPDSSADSRHLSGLDGLRAISVLAVVAYHAGATWLPGGFLGVEVFFVISGFLITSLLLDERRRTGRIDVVRFWARRARRLLPALFVLLAGVLAFAVVVLPDEVHRLRHDALAAAAYVTNWHLIVGDQSYFEAAGRPSLFLHLWSLAIEEQFYLAWPILLSVALVVGRRAAVVLMLLGAAASAGTMAILFDPALDPSRVYYGTDTRLSGLLLGAALGAIQRRPFADAASGIGPRSVVALRTVGIAGLVVLGVAFATIDAVEPFVYQGGFVIVGLAVVAIIAAAIEPATRLGAVLDAGPMRWIGTRSYSIYLWHWPVFMVTRPGFDIPLEPLPALAVRLGVTAALAELSYRCVEMPIRTGALGRVLDGGRRRAWRPVGAISLAGILSVVLVSAVVATPTPTLESGVRTGSIDEVIVPPVEAPLPSVTPAPRATTVAAPVTTRPPATPPPPMVPAVAPSLAPSEPVPEPTPGVLAFGDSVMVQGARALAKELGPIQVDASIGRQVADAIADLRERAAERGLPPVVVIQVGNNGPFKRGQADALMEILRDVPTVVWVDLRVPRAWEAKNNEIIAKTVAAYPNARLVTWHAATAGRKDLFWKDGYHPRAEGAALYARLVSEALD